MGVVNIIQLIEKYSIGVKELFSVINSNYSFCVTGEDVEKDSTICYKEQRLEMVGKWKQVGRTID